MEIDMLNKICKFKSFPFDIRPSKYPHIWAGHKELKDELNYFCKNVIINHLSEFGIVTGTHGSGKSHTLLHAKYLTENQNVPCLSIYIENPCGLGAKGQFIEVYRYILSTSIGWDEIFKIFSNAKKIIFDIASDRIENMQEEERKEIHKDDEKKESVRKEVYKEIAGETPISYNDFIAIADGEEKIRQKIEKFPSHIICAKALSTIIELATLKNSDRSGMYSAFFIFVDQTEDIATLKPGPYQEQIVGWRTLIDEADRSFGMLWAMDGSAEDIYGVLSDAIERRQTISPEKLRLLELQDEEAYAFIIDILKEFREENANLPDEYPFNEESIKEIITQTPRKSPSHLLNSFRTVYTKVAQKDLIKSERDVITKEIAIQNL